PSTAFLLVSSPRRDAVNEALFFAERLGRSHITVQGLVVNRLHPRFEWAGGATVPATASTPMPDGAGASRDGGALAVLVANRDQFRTIGEREERHLAALAAQVAPAPVARVPFLAVDVHDLDGLAEVADHIFEPERPRAA